MKKSIRNTLMGTTISLAAMGASAADIFLTPASPTVNIGDTLTLTVQGANFTDLMTSGGVTVTWDPTVLSLTSSELDLASTLPVGFIPLTNTVGSGTLNLSAGTFGAAIGPAFDFFSMDFTALPPGGVSNVAVGLGVNGNWQDGLGLSIPNADVSYTGATVTVNEVPLPAAVWLFGTGLLGLAGVARRRNQAAA